VGPVPPDALFFKAKYPTSASAPAAAIPNAIFVSFFIFAMQSCLFIKYHSILKYFRFDSVQPFDDGVEAVEYLLLLDGDVEQITESRTYKRCHNRDVNRVLAAHHENYL
jgi:hypothetical protein